MDRPQWFPMDDPPPPGTPVLIWIDGGFAIAVLVKGEEAGAPWQVFMDRRSDEILPWPSHWMPLPSPPDSSNRNNDLR